MDRLDEVRKIPGVYLLIGLDDEPLYAGQGKNLRARLAGHFVRQSSNATADGLLDIYEVSRVAVWYAEPRYPLFPEVDPTDEGRMQALDILEISLLKRFVPKWNRARKIYPGVLPELTIENANLTVDLIGSPEEAKVRRLPMQRIESKLLHMLRAVRKARISGASRGVKKAMVMHAKELTRLCERDPGGSKDRNHLAIESEQ